ncbi:hypothetical protein PRK78_004791 [Emydomyces testavorans]|uniref:C3H1-type domain-containing protein n=1 Tax=Emydomyces testavorans TaxID=2070801 RepID=A0AAF0IJX5_9EURO|nr:hypothetical protein PRK78_004791 [Emydomyces testavorans]
MSEDQDLLARIGQLAGRINQRKNQLTTPSRGEYSGTSSHHTYSAPHRAHLGWAPYRGRGRPSSRRAAGPHRHRTLVLNSPAAASDTTLATPSNEESNDEKGDMKPPQQSGWVAKRDRHMQLINTAIYDQEAQARAKAIEETRRLQVRKRAEREKENVLRFAQRTGAPGLVADKAGGGAPADSYRIMIDDIPFQVIKGGSKLIRLSSEAVCGVKENLRTGLPWIDDPTTANATPKKVTVGGVKFVRSKHGNLHRLGAVVSKKSIYCDGYPILSLCYEKALSFEGYPRAFTDGNSILDKANAPGSCYKGPKCPYIHDPNKVAICKEFLQTGKCSAGAACDLSHEPSPERSPACMHFLRGRCSNPECRYAHVRVTPGAPVCRGFAILGYCSKGAACQDRHVNECPDYANTGKCGKLKCPLPHIDRAGQIRKLAANKTGNDNNMGSTEEDEEDISSEEEAYDEIDSDDVDSDELDDNEPELIIPDTHAGEEEVTKQHDFIRF